MCRGLPNQASHLAEFLHKGGAHHRKNTLPTHIDRFSYELIPVTRLELLSWVVLK